MILKNVHIRLNQDVYDGLTLLKRGTNGIVIRPALTKDDYYCRLDGYQSDILWKLHRTEFVIVRDR